MFARYRPHWKGRIGMKTKSHSRDFTVTWDGEEVGVVRQFIPLGHLSEAGCCRFQAVTMKGAHVGPEEGYRERITAIEKLIPRQR